ncbi:hypothetical protein C0995_004292 [Termitomyces sp. Mi166|nr:hypothetical protein C0995_004292 [Termitomyces sp. Mi166\
MTEKDLAAPDLDDDDVPTFSFNEEPLGIGAVYGYGYFQDGPGSTLGPQNRYKVEAKLGFGATSSVWLARDDVEKGYVSIKILTGKATQLNEKNFGELEVYQLLSKVTPSIHTPRLLDHFTHPGIEDDGDHLCLVIELLHSDLRRAPVAADGFLPVPDLKRLLTQVLHGLTQLHKCGVAHTDLKGDNIMIDNERLWTTATIDAWLKANPPRTHPPTQRLHGMVTASVSQAFPPPTLDMLASCAFKLADFGSAQIVSQKTTDAITPLSVRPPEVVLRGCWDESVEFGHLAVW